MAKKQILRDYTTDQMVELIKQRIHNSEDRKMVYMRLIDGATFEKISERTGYTEKTVRTHIHRCEEILFKHL